MVKLMYGSSNFIQMDKFHGKRALAVHHLMEQTRLNKPQMADLLLQDIRLPMMMMYREITEAVIFGF